MTIANNIKHRSDNLLFQMILAKQQTTTDLTKRCRYVSDDYCEITYGFKDNSSLTFITNDSGNINLAAQQRRTS